MSKYIGKPCAACEKTFDMDDDIVVCPDCGAPHHRECYNVEGKCAQSHLHDTHDAYYINERSRELLDRLSACPNCGSKREDVDKPCPSCGYVMPEVSKDAYNTNNNQRNNSVFEEPPVFDRNTYMTYGLLNPHENLNGVSAKELAVFVGKSSAYFLSKFKLLSMNSKNIQINFAAFVFNFAYFFYRKMYKIGTILFLVFVITSIPGIMITAENSKQLLIDAVSSGEFMGYDTTSLQQIIDVNSLPKPDLALIEELENLQSYSTIASILSSLFASLYANSSYYKHCLSKIKYIRAGYSNFSVDQSYHYALAKKGRTSLLSAVLLMLLYSFGSTLYNYLFLSNILMP